MKPNTDAYVTIVCGQGDTFVNVVDKPVWDRLQASMDVNDSVLGLQPSDCIFHAYEHITAYKFIRENNINVIDVFEGLVY